VKSSLIISGIAHGAILLWAVTGISATREFKAEPVKSIPVDIMSASEFTRIKAGTKKGEEKKASAPVVKPTNTETQKKKSKPKSVKAVRPPKQEEAKTEAPPKPKPNEVAKTKPKPKKKMTKKKIASKNNTRQSKGKKSFDEDRIAALLNKIPDSGGPQQLNTPEAPKKEQSKGAPDGRAAMMSVNEIDAFRAQISQCWNPPIGGLGAERITVKIRLMLNLDGTLKQPPKVLNSMSAVSFRPAADSAVRAIWQCQPYKLPEKKYQSWSDMILNFDPREMYAG